ncbi:zinc finger E-box-binding homeobox 1b isoform X1 [Engraulis encrasicolus]|uniref:zinc finger E-box-binding homeobox 1b isoform X1 n=2 Tax=Engraulis encrasicolus TaxID=184585 RepID=UPI002FD48391
MADGPRCKRRKQANPRRTSVSNYSAVVEGSSDSDDEDKLHIAEEEGSLPDADSVAPDDDPNGNADPDDRWDEGLKEECVSEGDDERSRDADALVEEMLQAGDTHVIYPEAPEDAQENGTPDAFSQLLTCPYCSRGYKRYASLKEHVKLRHEKSEDNYSCSLCSYTFSQRAQLDRHMSAHKNGRDQRHVAQSGGNRKFKCTECGKAFKYKHHLKEHLRIHSGEKPYECSNCKKRFSHSGSYSSHISSKKCIGMLSFNANRSSRPPASAQTPSNTPAAPQSREKSQTNAKLQPETPSLPVAHIKAEPMESELKPGVVPANGPSTLIQTSTTTNNNNATNHANATATATTVPTATAPLQLLLPTVGLVSPVSISLAQLQSLLKAEPAVVGGGGNHLTLNTTNSINAQAATTGPLIQTISLPLLDQDGHAKILINYSLDPSQTHAHAMQTQTHAILQLKKETLVPVAMKTEKEREAEDLTLKKRRRKDEEVVEEEMEVPEEKREKKDSAGMKDVDVSPSTLGSEGEVLNGHEPTVAATPVSKATTPVSMATTPGSGVEGQKKESLQSVLKAYYALNAKPEEEEVARIATAVSLSPGTVTRWFHKMAAKRARKTPAATIAKDDVTSADNGVDKEPSGDDNEGDDNEGDKDGEKDGDVSGASDVEISPQNTPLPTPTCSRSPSPSPTTTHNPAPASASATTNDQSQPSVPQSQSPGPLNLSADGPIPCRGGLAEGEGPLDLSMPKGVATTTSTNRVPAPAMQDEPLNLTCAKKDAPSPPANALALANGSANPLAIHAPPNATAVAASNPISIMATQLPTLLAISDQGGNKTILIPQLAYTYATTTTTTPATPTTVPAAAETPAPASDKEQVLHVNGIKEEKSEGVGESVSEEQNDSDSGVPKKKMRRTEGGQYACDLCDKIFQKSSSLLRHKYEHTGKRPHECGICNKAFKHKHHLIEHTRLHSGEKPYQCDKCGKRFSHSGSYSQHMNHRYSYCRKDSSAARNPGTGAGAGDKGGGGGGSAGGSRKGGGGGGLPGSGATSPLQGDSDERESEEGEETGASGSMVDEDEIQVVRVGDDGEYDDEEEEEDEEEGEEEEGEEVERGEGMEVGEHGGGGGGGEGDEENGEMGEEEELADGEMMTVVVMEEEREQEEGEEEEEEQREEVNREMEREMEGEEQNEEEIEMEGEVNGTEEREEVRAEEPVQEESEEQNEVRGEEESEKGGEETSEERGEENTEEGTAMETVEAGETDQKEEAEEEKKETKENVEKADEAMETEGKVEEKKEGKGDEVTEEEKGETEGVNAESQEEQRETEKEVEKEGEEANKEKEQETEQTTVEGEKEEGREEEKDAESQQEKGEEDKKEEKEEEEKPTG